MPPLRRRCRQVASFGVLLGMVFHSSAFGSSPPPATPVVEKSYRLEAVLYSIISGVNDYEYGSRGEGQGVFVTLGLHCRSTTRSFAATIQLWNQEGRLKTKIEIRPDPGDRSTQPQTLDFDLSDLKPMETELARDRDTGRRYMLRLVPDVEVVDRSPRRLKADEFRLTTFSFRRTPVIIDDRRYVGILQASGGELAYVGIPGIGKVEFSLVPFRGAQAIGTLEDGALHIALPDTISIDIYGVANGDRGEILPGGPFQTWVRWTRARMSEQEWIAKELENLSRPVASGSPDAALLEEMRKATLEDLRKGHVLRSGISSLPPEDRLEP